MVVKTYVSNTDMGTAVTTAPKAVAASTSSPRSVGERWLCRNCEN